MQDLSNLAKNGPWITSQAGGNMMSSTEQAMTAPGSHPADPLPDRDEQGDPKVSYSGPQLPVGTPPPRIGHSYSPSALSWKETPDG
jgi:hypothetical protein